MAKSKSKKAHWLNIALRIVALFFSILNFYSFFSGPKLTTESIWNLSPWPMDAVFLSLGLAFLSILVASSLSVITPVVIALWNFAIAPYKNAKRLEATRNQDVLKTMEHLRAFCYERASRNQTWIGAYEKIHRVEMENLGLSLPEYATNKQWVVYLDRIMPFVQQHGLRQAKHEAQNWKWHKQPPPADIDDEVPF
ncbi:MAG: hypothetical protein OXI35_02815 [Gemmatimonadota bacterium]|nr:hypothetical protein [Gemmatimonadota bacterium]